MRTLARTFFLLAIAGSAACSIGNAPDDALPLAESGGTDTGTGGGGTSDCGEGELECDGACVDVLSNDAHCGTCGKTCEGDASCSDGQCLVDCSDGTICGSTCADLETDPNNCGGCGVVCEASGANSEGVCVAGQCDEVCSEGFGDCNTVLADGCETNLNDDLGNCGGCGNACVGAANAVPACDMGSCDSFSACAPGYDDCDGAAANGCEADTQVDPKNCNTCGNNCANLGLGFCVDAVCTDLFWAMGVQQNLPEADLGGWQLCYSDLYDNSSTAMSTILNQCNGSKLLLGCRPVGGPNLVLAAMGDRPDVLFDCGTDPDCTHEANGVGWYWSDSYSWGFVPAGEEVSRNSCDTDSNLGEQRMCWHAGGGNINSGYRCGNTFLNGDPTWERLVYHVP